MADPAGADLERLVDDAWASCNWAVDRDDVADVVGLALELGVTPAEIIESAPTIGELILDRHLRPLGSRTAGEAVTEAGVPWTDAEPFLWAVGLRADPAERLTDDEAETVRLVVGGAREVLGDEAALQLARVMGNTAARLGETLVSAFRLRVETPQRDAGLRYADIVREYSALAAAFLPTFSRALDAMLRRQILVTASTMWSTDEERSAVTLRRTVGFADLVGYTEGTATMSVRELTSVLVDFDRRTADVVRKNAGSVVKTIGDEVLFSTEEPAAACRIALELIGAFASTGRQVRIGLASGEMVSVFGDLYGADVNLAARLVSAADPSTAVASPGVRDAAPAFEFEELEPLTLKGLSGPVKAYRLLGEK
jgi:adenylate cyclase